MLVTLGDIGFWLILVIEFYDLFIIILQFLIISWQAPNHEENFMTWRLLPKLTTRISIITSFTALEQSILLPLIALYGAKIVTLFGKGHL
jgi:hypothetical protein